MWAATRPGSRKRPGLRLSVVGLAAGLAAASLTAIPAQVAAADTTFVPITTVPSTCDPLTAGFSMSGTAVCGGGYIYINTDNPPASSVSYTFDVPSGESKTLTYGIPAGGYYNNTDATISVDGVDSATLPSNVSEHPFGDTNNTGSDLALWTSNDLGPGTHTWTITSAGSSVNVYGLTVTTTGTPITTTVYDAASNNPWDGTEVAGASVYDTATVTGGGSVAPTGWVTFKLYDNGTCTGSLVTEPESSSIDEYGHVSSVSTGPLDAGTYGYTATYSGDDNYDSSAATCEPFTVGSASSVAATLSAGSPTVASVQAVPESALPSSAVESAASGTGSGHAGSAPLRSIPLRSISLGSIPLRSIPLRSIPLRSIPAAARALSSTLLSDLPIEYPPGCSGTACTGWTGVLAGTPLAINPLQSTSLADVLADPTAAARFESVPLSGLDVSATALASLPLAAVALAGTPLRSIALPGADGTATGDLTAWCTQLASMGFDCATDFGIDPATPSTANGVDILALSLAGVPLRSIPLRSIPLRSIDLSSSALASIPLRSIDLTASPLRSIPLRSIDLTASPLRSIPLRSIGSLSSVIDCSLVDCPTGTLGDAATAGAIVSTATLEQLATLDSAPLRSIPLRSIDLSTSPLRSIPLRSIGSLSSVVDCTLVDCSVTSTATLGDAATANAILATASLYDLGAFLSTALGQFLSGLNYDFPGFPSLTLSDLLAALTPPTSYPWQSVDLSSVPLAQNESAGGTDTLSASVTVSAGAPAPVDVTLTLPPGFAYLPGSATLDTAALADPASTSSPLDWHLTLPPGSHTLSVTVAAGIGLGPVTAHLSAAIGATTPVTSSTTVNVVDGLNPNSTPPSASPLASDSLNFGYLISAGDRDYWSVPVSQGQELALSLSNLPADYDLTLFAPNGQQLQGNPVQQAPGVTDAPPSLTTESQPVPGGNDVPVTPPPGYQLDAQSNNRGTDDETIQTTPLDAGTYVIQITGYNGASSPNPYLLRATAVSAGATTTCPAITYPNPTPAAAAAPVIPTGANTLFLVNTQRLRAAYGDSSESQVMSALAAVAGDSSDGVIAAVVPVDSSAAVRSAYNAWNDGANANPCSVQAANAVVSSVSTLVDQIRFAQPGITNVVIVGADDQIPFARIADGATQSNERDYASSTFPGESNVLANTLAQGFYLSDDPYTANRPLSVGSATLYTPQVAVGRLVESPSQIEGALRRFVSSHGVLDSSAALSTGYSFLTSGASLVATNLSKVSGRHVADLINDDWTHSQLDQALTATPAPGLDSINAHFDFSRALPAIGNTTGDQSDLFSTTDVRGAPANTYAGRLLFSMGCHAGLTVDDAEVASSGIPTPVDDWAKTFADSGALWVANTGYGYGDTETVAYSARLMAGFADGLDGSTSIGAALTDAKQTYAAGDTVLSAYDLKAMMESTFYGLPMYHLNSTPPAAPAPPTPPATQSDPITGLSSASISLSLPIGASPGDLGLQHGAHGTYYQVNGSNASDGQTQTTEYRPIEPLATVDVTQPSPTTPGALSQVAHGALITGLSSTDITPFTPAIAEPAVDTTGNAAAGLGVDPFPAQLQRVATYQTVGSTGVGQHQQFDFVAGQFLPDPQNPGQGTQRLFTSVQASVLYRDPSITDFTPSTIATTDAYVSGGRSDFVVDASDPGAPIERVLVLYTDAQNPGSWTALDLASTDGQHWSGSGTATASGKIAYFVQVVDAAGNVAVSSNKGAYFPAQTLPTRSGDIAIALGGSPQVGGYFTGPVTATISGPSGLSYSLDGSDPQPVPTGGQVPVEGDGAHQITVSDALGDTDGQLVRIDTLKPDIATSLSPSPVGTPPGFVAPGAALNVAATDAGSGVASVSYSVGGGPAVTFGGSSGSIVVTASESVVITATDKVGNVATTTVAVNVDGAAPVTSCSAPTAPPGAWTNHDVSETCVVSDTQSGLATASQATVTVATSVPNAKAMAAAMTNDVSVCDKVGNCVPVGPFGPFEVDQSAPVPSAATTPSPSPSGWVAGSAVLTLSATDTGSGVKSITYTLTGAQTGGATVNGSSATVPLTAAGTTIVSVFATDNVGNVSSSTTLTVKVDKAGPVISCTAPTQTGWSATDVSVPCTATDGQSGLATASPTAQSPLSFALSTSVAGSTDSTTAKTGTQTVCDEVGNCLTTASYGPFKVDKKAPAITITTPITNATYYVGQSVKAAYSCGDSGSGLASCTGTLANGAAIPTGSVGTFTLTVTAKDKVGNTGTQSVTYSVANKLCVVITPAPHTSSAVLITAKLCDSSGHNLTTSKTVLTAVRIDASTTPVSAVSDPKNTFFFVPVVNTDVYTLQDSKLSAGSHTLYVTVAGDPTPHPIPFTVSH